MQAGNAVQEGNQRHADGVGSSEEDGSILYDLEKNDISNSYMELSYFDHCICIDWVERGKDAFANATNLKGLDIEGGSTLDRNDSEWQNGVAFFRSLSANRSIEQLRISGCIIDVGKMFETMMPFFEGNSNLRSLEFSSIGMCQQSNDLLVAALSECNNLRSLDFHSSGGMDSDLATTLIEGLGTHQKLKSLTLNVGEIQDNKWCSALEVLLLHPTSKLEELNLEESGINNEGIAFIGRGLANNTTLKKLNLQDNPDITTGWVTFANCLIDSTCSLETLNLNCNGLSDVALAALADFFAGRNNIKELSLRDNVFVSQAGWGTFFQRLHNSNTKFESLDLCANHIGDTGIVTMVVRLMNMSSLKFLNASSDPRPAISGARAIISLVSSPNSSLESLDCLLDASVSVDEIAEWFADALSTNEHMKYLRIEIAGLPRITSRGRNALARLLCNTDSIESIYMSNHTLQRVDFVWRSSLTPYLEVNRNDDKFEVARQKILQYHFSGGTNNMQDVLDLEQEVLPHVLSWAGRDSTGWPMLYNILRGEPSLFDSHGKTSIVTGKRKRAV